MPPLKTSRPELGQYALIERPAATGQPHPSGAMITRTTRITIETESTLIVRKGRTGMAWCPECQAEVEVMLCEDSSLIHLLGGISGSPLHVWRPEGSSTLICLPSVSQVPESSKVQPPHIPDRKLTRKGEGK